MKAYQLFMLSMAIAIAISSCSPVLYSTTGQNVPLFRKKGEVVLNAGYFGIEDKDLSSYYDSENGFNAQFAAAIDSSVAIMSSLYTLNAGSDSEWEIKGSYFEAGVGIFKHGEVSKLTGELFAGIGFGSMKNSYDFENIDANYLKFFIQPSGGFSSKVLDMAFTPRMGLVTYTKHDSNVEEPEVDDYFSDKKTTFVFEPGITIRVGYKNVKLQYQFNYSTFHYKGTDEFDPVSNMVGSFNLFFLISDRWKDK
jgi:hypothetical protein